MHRFLILLCVLFSCATSSTNDTSARDRWRQAVSKFESYAHPLKHPFIQHLNVITEDHEISISPECRHGLRNFSSGLSLGRVHETAMFDAFSKVLPGTLFSQGYSFGAYEQCLDHGRYVYLGIDFPVPKDTKVRKFKQEDGQENWMVDYSKTMGVRRIDGFHFGICVPDQCHDADVKAVFRSDYVSKLITPLSVRVHTTDSKTDVVTKSWRQIISSSILLLIFLTGVTAAIVNKLTPGSKMAHKLRHFDVLANARQLISPPKQFSMFTSINLFRANYTVWSIFSHLLISINVGTQIVQGEVAFGMASLVSPIVNRIIRMVCSTAPPFLTFNMLVSSCFTTMKNLSLMQRAGVTFPRYLAERMLRILPSVGAVLLFTQTLPLVHLGGPGMKRMQTEYADLCYRNGWKVMLFVSNFEVMKDTCLPVAWFTSADFQIYFFTFPFLLLAARFPQHAIKFFSGVVGVGILASGAYFMRDGTSPVFPLDIEDTYAFYTQHFPSYYHTINSISVYGVGMILGYVLLQQKGIQKNCSIFSIWNACNVGSTVTVITAFAYWNGKFVAGPTAEIVYVAVIRTIFAAVFALMYYRLFNCSNPVLQSIASSRLMCTLSRVSMSWFFTHIIHIMFMTAARDTIQLSLSIILIQFFFVLITSFCTACLLHLFVEAPACSLVAACMPRPPKAEVVKNKEN